jgi:3-oxoadipate enol-lactonase
VSHRHLGGSERRVGLNEGRLDGGSAETVVFVSEVWSRGDVWRALEPFVAARYATLRYDPGEQGRSVGLSAPLAFEEHAAELKLLFDTLGLDAVHLVAHGSGAWLAAVLASSEPERVRSLVSVGGFVALDALMQATLRALLATLEAGGSALFAEVAAPWLWGKTFVEQQPDAFAAARAQLAAGDAEGYAAALRLLLSAHDARKALRAFAGPLLAVAPQEDLLAPLRHSHLIVEWARSGVLVTLERAGHMAMLERPEALARVLVGFLQRRDEFAPPETG